MSSPQCRDKLRDTWDICCFEMEAAGLMNDFPCILIRGISDYSDGHKNDNWQPYAAVAAAAYAKDLLRIVHPQEIDHTEVAANVLKDLTQSLDRVELGVAKFNTVADENQKTEILDWLSPSDYGTEQSDLFSKRQPGTGQWFINSSEFQHWLRGRNQSLLCQGIPGAGKTIMASIVINHLNSKYYDNRSTNTSFIYCNFRRQYQQKPTDFLASLLKQMVWQHGSLPEDLISIYERHKVMKTRPSDDEILEALRTALSVCKQVFIVIDALDEIQVSDGGRATLLSRLFALQESASFNLLATSRFVPEIEEEFRKRESAFLEIRAMDDDVRNYIDGHISLPQSIISKDPWLENEVKTKIIDSVDGMFLLAKLHLDSLQDKVSRSEVRLALANLPRGSMAYNEAYEEAMGRIRCQLSGFRNLALQAIAWITCARTPLTTHELQHALATRRGMTEFDEDSLVDVSLIASVTSGLVAVDEKSNIIRLVHYTVQEYFDHTWEDWFPNAHRDIAYICLTYLTFDTIRTEAYALELSQTPLYKLPQYLHKYAAQNWGHHARIQSVDERLVFRLLEHDQKLLASIYPLILPRSPNRARALQTAKHVTKLHLAAYSGLENIVETIIKNGCDHTAKDEKGRTALSWAAVQGHETTVQVLLDSGLDPNSEDETGISPLAEAFLKGHDTILRLFMKNNHRPILSQFYCYEAQMILAAGRGHLDVVKSLSEKGLDPNSIGEDHTALLLAATHGRLQ